MPMCDACIPGASHPAPSANCRAQDRTDEPLRSDFAAESKTPMRQGRRVVRIGADAIPNVALHTAGDTTTLFLARGIATLREAARYLWALPYGRVSNALRPDLVLHEGRGTCTTKHALLASLAAEQEIDLALTLGVYEMTERNTPGVGPVLDRYGLEAIPEAHCYVVWQGERIDITRPVNAPEAITRFLYEERVCPKNIAPYKMRIHRQCLNEWKERGGTSAVQYSLEELWRIREECIAALERASTTAAECRTFVKDGPPWTPNRTPN